MSIHIVDAKGKNCAYETLALALKHVKDHVKDVAKLYRGNLRTRIRQGWEHKKTEKKMITGSGDSFKESASYF